MPLRIRLLIPSLALVAFTMTKPGNSTPPAHGLLVVANQAEHTVLLIDPENRRELANIAVVDLAERKLAATIDLGKPLRPHGPEFGPDGMLYVTAELANAIDVLD